MWEFERLFVLYSSADLQMPAFILLNSVWAVGACCKQHKVAAQAHGRELRSEYRKTMFFFLVF